MSTVISSELYERLVQTLLRCREFESQLDLYSSTLDLRLVTWRKSLPEATSIIERVQKLISYLLTQYSRDQENALVIFLKVLSDRYDPRDPRNQQLAELAKELADVLQHDIDTQRELLPAIKGIVSKTLAIPPELLERMRSTLTTCVRVCTQKELRKAFQDERLQVFAGQVPDDFQTDQVIDALGNQYNDTGENALAIFLRVSAEKHAPDKPCRYELLALANEFEKVLSDGVTNEVVLSLEEGKREVVPNIPPKILEYLRGILGTCGGNAFNSDRQLALLFMDARISPWRVLLRAADTGLHRIDELIAVLGNQYNSEGKNALVLFLGVIAERTDPGDMCRSELSELADNLEKILTPDIEIIIEDAVKTLAQTLNLSGKRLTELPPQIGELSQLETLDLSNNQLTTLPPEIGRLTKLRRLHLAGNALTALPAEIGRLLHLELLDLKGNQLTALPAELRQLIKLQTLDVRDNLLSVPPEILEPTAISPDSPQSPSASTILDYYFELREGEHPLNEAKVVLVGQGSVGKTSLVNRLIADSFNPNETKTEGIAVRHWVITPDTEPVTLNVWDFGGQEIMHATHQFFLTKRTLYMLVLDSRLGEAENRLEYWLQIIRSFGGDSPVLIVGNKTDQHPLDLDRRGLLAKYPSVQSIIETSCANGDGIQSLREAIAHQIAQMPHISDPLLNTWFKVKKQLEQMGANYITYAAYTQICCEKGVDNPDNQRVLLGFLHDLGVILHFPDPRLETTNILNPEWVTQGVYRILNTHLPFTEPGVLTWEMITCILDDETYTEKRMFIVDMMQKFELCYELSDRANTYLIPDLLPKEEPDTGIWSDALAFEVHYSVLPGNILTRLIVRMHRLIKERIAWRAGVLLTCDNNEALVRADLSANRITIAVRGLGSGRRELLTRIRHELENIHSTITGLRPEEKVPIPGHPEVKPVDYQHLRTLESLGEETFIPQGLAQRVSVRYLLDGVEPPEVRRERDAKYEVHIHGGQIGVIGDKADVEGGIHSS